MRKSPICPGRTSVFYKPAGVGVTEVRSGYLYKSPPSKHLKSEKSWKRRFFVMFKYSDNEFGLKYFRSPEEKDRPLGEIDLTSISLLYVSPEEHQKWGWIQKFFKLSASCVLYLRVGSRDYFLVGETSDDVDGWFSVVFDALKNRPHKFMKAEEMFIPQPPAESIPKTLRQRKSSASPSEKPVLRSASFEANDSGKVRSFSDPLSKTADTGQNQVQKAELSRRRASEPGSEIYDYPRSFLKQIQVGLQAEDNHPTSINGEALYESMQELRQYEDHEVSRVTSGSIMRSVNQAFDKLKTRISPQSFSEETHTTDRDDPQTSGCSSGSSSDNGATSPVEMLGRWSMHRLGNQSSTESLDHIVPEERDMEVNQADLKKHLTLTEVDGKPSVSGWTGLPQDVCLFHKGDQVLAINDLHISSVQEFNQYISKSLKNEVKLTILRLPGCLPLHLPNLQCSDKLSPKASASPPPPPPLPLSPGCV